MSLSRARLATRRSAGETRLAIERFLATSQRPTVFEPGAAPLAITPGQFSLDSDRADETLRFSVWDDQHNLVRRVTGLRAESRGRVELEVERFGGRKGELVLADLALGRNDIVARRGNRLVGREQFRRALARQFPGWSIGELTSEADLEHSLSPAFPRAWLHHGRRGLAALAAFDEAHAPGALTFGLLWLDYLRRRERSHAVEGLALFVPSGSENYQALRLRHLDRSLASYQLFVFAGDGYEEPVDIADTGNIDTHVEPRRTLLRPPADGCADEDRFEARLLALPHVEAVDLQDGVRSFRVRGLEFARRLPANEFLFGYETSRKATTSHWAEIEKLAALIAQLRSPEMSRQSTGGPLYRRHPERWLESQVRAAPEVVDPELVPAPVYGQVPAMAGEGRDVLDLLAVRRDGQLAVMELKATEDIHLPLQGLDYWIRVAYHLKRGDFSENGYFPGLRLDAAKPPRLLLVAPCLDIHPANETVLSYFSREIEAEQIGIGVEWRKEVKVMFRKRAAARRNETSSGAVTEH